MGRYPLMILLSTTSCFAESFYQVPDSLDFVYVDDLEDSDIDSDLNDLLDSLPKLPPSKYDSPFDDPAFVGNPLFSDRQELVRIYEDLNANTRRNLAIAREASGLLFQEALFAKEFKNSISILANAGTIARAFGVVGAVVSVLATVVFPPENIERQILEDVQGQIDSLSDFTVSLRDDLISELGWQGCISQYRDDYKVIRALGLAFDNYMKAPTEGGRLARFRRQCNDEDISIAIVSLLDSLNGANAQSNFQCDLIELVAAGRPENGGVRLAYGELYTQAWDVLRTALLGVQLEVSCNMLCAEGPGCSKAWVRDRTMETPAQEVDSLYGENIEKAFDRLVDTLEKWSEIEVVASNLPAAVNGFKSRFPYPKYSHERFANEFLEVLEKSYPGLEWFVASFDGLKNREGENIPTLSAGGDPFKRNWAHLSRGRGGKSDRDVAVMFDIYQEQRTCRPGTVEVGPIWESMQKNHWFSDGADTRGRGKRINDRMSGFDCGTGNMLSVYGGSDLKYAISGGPDRDEPTGFAEFTAVGKKTRTRNVGKGLFKTKIDVITYEYGYNFASLNLGCCYVRNMIRVYKDMCLSVSSDGRVAAKDQHVVIAKCDRADLSQRFQLEDRNGDRSTLRIRYVGTNVCMDLNGSSGSRDTRRKNHTEYVQMSTCTNHKDQRFLWPKEVNTGRSTLLRHSSGACMDINRENRNPGAGAILSKCHGRVNQQFFLVPEA